MACGCNKTTVVECVEENACADSIFPSKKAAKFSVSEMLLNLFCAIRSIAHGISKIEETIVDRIDQHLADLPTGRSQHHEVWGFDEAVGEEERKVCMLEKTEKLQRLDIYSFSPGIIGVGLNIKINGVTAKSTSLSSFRTMVLMNHDVMSGDILSFEITTSDVYGVTGWTHLATYIVF